MKNAAFLSLLLSLGLCLGGLPAVSSATQSTGGALAGAPGGLPVGKVYSVKAKASFLMSTVPANTVQLVLEESRTGQSWRPVVTRHLNASSSKKGRLVSFSKPTTSSGKRSARMKYRVVAYTEALFPKRITSAANQFPKAGVGQNPGLTLNPTQGDPRWSVNVSDSSSVTASVAGTQNSNPGNNSSLSSSPGVVQESDIWKRYGNRLFFFNQLRGLQVLDVTNPEQPTRLGTLRIIANGEEFFSLDETGSRLALIGTENYTNTPRTYIRLVRVSAAGVPTLERTVELPGSYVDSRLEGSRLHVVTQRGNSYYGGIFITNSIGTGRQGFLSTDALPTLTMQTGVLSTAVLASSMVAVPQSAKLEFPEHAPEAVVHALDLSNFAEPVVDSDLAIAGVATAVQSASGKLLVATRPAYDYGRWNWGWGAWWLPQGKNEIHVICQGVTGPERQRTLEAPGTVMDKFKLSVHKDHVVSVTQASMPTGLETYVSSWTLSGTETTPVSEISLPGARNEQLHATRYDGDRLYVVTFQRTDPLFMVDMKDPAKLALLAELEIPGWSTYLQPMGDRLLSVGVENGRVAVSWFDVATPTSMSLVSRVYLGKEGQGSWSEGNYDEKAVEVYPEAGLLMLPFQAYSEKGYTSAMQEVLMVDDALKLGRTVAHKSYARRGTLIGNYLVSLSGKEYIAMDRTEEDSDPEVQISLAWNVDAIARVRGHLLQVANGSIWGPTEPPMLRITKDTSVDELVEEIQLGESGRILAIKAEGQTAWILQELPPAIADGTTPAAVRTWRVDLSKLPEVTTSSVDQVLPEKFQWTGYGSASGHLVRPDLLVWHFTAQEPYLHTHYGYYSLYGYYGTESENMVWSVGTGAKPVSGGIQRLGLGSAGQVFTSNGFLFLSRHRWFKESSVYLNVLDCRQGAPVLRMEEDLPGSLVGVSHVSGQGAVLFTTKYENKYTTDEAGQISYNYAHSLSASGYDGSEVWELDSVALQNGNILGSVNVGGKIYAATTVYSPEGSYKHAIRGYEYDLTTARLNPTANWELEHQVSSLHAAQGKLLIHSFPGRQLRTAAVQNDGSLVPLVNYTLPYAYSMNLPAALLDADGIWIPMGEYGVEVLK